MAKSQRSQAIDRLANDFGLPTDLKEFWEQEGRYEDEDSGVAIFDPVDCESFNQRYAVQQFQPGWLAIGLDGEDRAFVVKKDSNQVYLVPLGAYQEEELEVVASSFSVWRSQGFRLAPEGEGEVDDPLHERADLYLTGMPTGGLPALVELKRALNLSLSAEQLLEGAKSPPFKLMSSVYRQRYEPWCEGFNLRNHCLDFEKV